MNWYECGSTYARFGYYLDDNCWQQPWWPYAIFFIMFGIIIILILEKFSQKKKKPNSIAHSVSDIPFTPPKCFHSDASFHLTASSSGKSFTFKEMT